MNVKVIPATLQREKQKIDTYLCINHKFENQLSEKIDNQIGYYLDEKEAKNLKVGDVLCDGSTVTWIGEIEEL
jgi:hypothetical protein